MTSAPMGVAHTVVRTRIDAIEVAGQPLETGGEPAVTRMEEGLGSEADLGWSGGWGGDGRQAAV